MYSLTNGGRIMGALLGSIPAIIFIIIFFAINPLLGIGYILFIALLVFLRLKFKL